MSKKEGGSSLFGILRIALPLALGVMVVVFLFFPDTFQSANDSVRKILPSTNGLEKGMLRYEELEQSKIYTSLAEALQNPNEVRVLNLSKQRITEIPASIAKLKNLQFLELQDNNIEYIAKEIGSLPLLQELYLGKNRLTTLPPEMGNLKNLRVLDLSNNRLREIPQEVSYLGKLEEIDLRQNQLLAISQKIKSNYSLKILRLSNNRLTKIPEELTRLDSLKFVDLSGNKSLEIRGTFEMLGKCVSLRTLELNDQTLRIIPKEIAELRNLKNLSLRNNKLPETERQNARNFLPNTVIEF